eukprot:9472419-Pyramimonas_sp.AAC.1
MTLLGTINSTNTCTNSAVRYAKGCDGNVTLDQDESAKQLRPIQHPELTGADAEAKESKIVTDTFVSLGGALAYALIARVWLMVYVVSLQRVQERTDMHVRRLNAITRKLQACPEKIAYQAMAPTGEVDLQSALATVA